MPFVHFQLCLLCGDVVQTGSDHDCRILLPSAEDCRMLPEMISIAIQISIVGVADLRVLEVVAPYLENER